MQPRPGGFSFIVTRIPWGCRAAAICLSNANSQELRAQHQTHGLGSASPGAQPEGSTGPSAWIPDHMGVREVLPHVILCLSETLPSLSLGTPRKRQRASSPWLIAGAAGGGVAGDTSPGVRDRVVLAVFCICLWVPHTGCEKTAEKKRRHQQIQTHRGISPTINVAVLINLVRLFYCKLFIKAGPSSMNAMNSWPGLSRGRQELCVTQASSLLWSCGSLKNCIFTSDCVFLINLTRFTLWPHHSADTDGRWFPAGWNHSLSLILFLQKKFLFFMPSLHLETMLLFERSPHLKMRESGAVF